MLVIVVPTKVMLCSTTTIKSVYASRTQHRPLQVKVLNRGPKRSQSHDYKISGVYVIRNRRHNSC